VIFLLVMVRVSKRMILISISFLCFAFICLPFPVFLPFWHPFHAFLSFLPLLFPFPSTSQSPVFSHPSLLPFPCNHIKCCCFRFNTDKSSNQTFCNTN
jgi:hypothetical protein